VVRDSIRRYVDAAQSLTDVPRERAERIAKRLASSGLIERTQIRDVASDLVERSRENRRRIADMVTNELRRQVARLGLATKADIDRLSRRVGTLESAGRRAGAGARPAAARKRPATGAKTTKKRSTASRKKPASRRR
jgi:polyhydroxyalkanoate synthesis regulator phasin